MGPISKTGGAGWVGGRFQEIRMGGVPCNSRYLCNIGSLIQDGNKRRLKWASLHLVTNFGNSIQFGHDPL